MKDIQIFSETIHKHDCYNDIEKIIEFKVAIVSFINEATASGHDVDVQWLQSSEQYITILTAICTVTAPNV